MSKLFQRSGIAALLVTLCALFVAGVVIYRLHEAERTIVQLSQIPRNAAEVPVDGNWGYDPSPEKTQEFVATLDKPTLSERAPQLFAQPPPAEADEPVLLYRELLKVKPDWIVGRQGIGDCVSWGWGHGCDFLLAVEVSRGESGEWHSAATEAIYGGSRVEAVGASRGGYSDGSYGGAAAKWVKNFGVVHRQKYADPDVDLTTYSASRAKDWGNFGCGGRDDKGRLDNVAKLHPVKTVALVTDFDEAAAAIKNGYPVPVCSGQGFSSRRDEQGFAAASGSWAHCMCFIGYRGGDRPGLLCLNSWGPNWIGGPKQPNDQPDGSFWVDKRIVNRMLSGRDSFAISGYEGFPRRKFRHSEGW